MLAGVTCVKTYKLKGIFYNYFITDKYLAIGNKIFSFKPLYIRNDKFLKIMEYCLIYRTVLNYS